MDLKEHIRSIQDYPKKGILFRDITTLIKNEKAFKECINQIIDKSKKFKFDKIAAIESRGFIFASILAYKTQKPLILARKSGKLPGKTTSKSFALEYGEACIEIKDEDVKKDDKFIIVDDLIATGGTIQAVIDIIKEKEAIVDSVICLIDLEFIGGSQNIKKQGINFIKGVKYVQ